MDHSLILHVFVKMKVSLKPQVTKCCIKHNCYVTHTHAEVVRVLQLLPSGSNYMSACNLFDTTANTLLQL